MKIFNRLAAITASLLITANSALIQQNYFSEINSKAAYDSCIVENLNRGISAINTGSGMLISWRFLANDPDNATFNLYRDDKLIYTSNSNESTCYFDSTGSASSIYRIDTLNGSELISSEKCSLTSNTNYFDIPLNIPAASNCTYTAGDCSVGDVDGDGTYEIFVKWDPSNAKDNSQSGETGNVYIDCYTLTGKQLWRIDLGQNIRAGAHYTQFLVADFDCDGKAEMTCKTADGTKDGVGNIIGDASKNYRNSSGYILDGPEYYTLFDGATGKALDTVDYEFPRGKVADWGDKYGNRVDRFLGAVAYLDGVHPSAVSVRGYYTRMTAVAYDVVNKKLVKRWTFDSNNSASAAAKGNGNHNCMAGDVDGDGKQELVLGATCIDDDGKLLWCTKLGHGDAMHLADLLPDRIGLELWTCHEAAPYGVSLIDAKDGSIIFHYDGSKDTGRCCAGNVYAGNKGSEFWGAASNDVYNGYGNSIGTKRPAQNFLIYWDGDFERELLDGTNISKMTSTTKIETLFSAEGCVSINGTKANPCLSADIFGDWREEVIFPTSDSSKLRIFCTPYLTGSRITTLMHDVQYRTQVAGEQNCYNQPAYTSFYLGSDEKMPDRPSVKVNGSSKPVEPVTTAVTQKPTVTTTQQQSDTNPTEIIDGGIYVIKNLNSGLYLNVENNVPSNVSNVQQSLSDSTTWKLISKGDGYYSLIPQIGDNSSFALDVTAKKTDNGTNIQIYNYSGNDNQQFKLVKNSDGSYLIQTKISNNASCIEVINGSTTDGANVQQWELNGYSCQSWILTLADTPTTPADTGLKITYGDANCDGNVDVSDAVLIKCYLLNNQTYNISSQGIINADVHASGNGINTQDAVAIQKYILNIINKLPV